LSSRYKVSLQNDDVLCGASYDVVVFVAQKKSTIIIIFAQPIWSVSSLKLYL